MKSVFICQLSAINFKNLASVLLEPDPKLNIFLGQNGQGKTNLLEAISLACSLKNLRSAKNPDLILFGQNESRIQSHIQSHDEIDVDIAIFPEGKKVLVNEKPIRDASALNQHTAVVSFIPDDLHMVIGGPAFRRTFLDQLCSGLFALYSGLYKRYEKTLLHRNRILKSPIIDEQELKSFTQILNVCAEPIIAARRQAIEILQTPFNQTFENILHDHLAIEISYVPKLILEENLNEEKMRRVTLGGPHLDDLHITLQNHAARSTASRGQARAIVLALKMAQMKVVAEHKQLAPLLLLDDVVGELDPDNARRLLETIDALGAQTFITTTHLDALPANWRSCRQFEVSAGQIR